MQQYAVHYPECTFWSGDDFPALSLLVPVKEILMLRHTIIT